MVYQQVIITGASSGFGMAYARYLGGECDHMVLIARRYEMLLELKVELQGAFTRLKVECIACDLAQPAQRDSLIVHLKAGIKGPTLLINNAGLGDYGSFAEGPSSALHQMIEVNMAAPTYLCHALLPEMKREGGAVMNIASLAADLFIPDFAVYAATKSYLASLSEALNLELREAGIPVLAVCPGPVHTGFGAVARRAGFTGNMTPGKDFFDTDVGTVIDGSIRALRNRKSRYYPSVKIRLLALLIRNMPLAVMRFIMSYRPRKVQSEKGGQA
ncbi:MAG: SDR family NAD(P)-dependent oxidoreductase [Akkermansia sp.]